MTYKFRKGADNGSWCSTLLPLCLIPLLIKCNSGVYLQQFAVCLTCCLFSLLTKEGQLLTLNSYTNSIFLAGFSIPLSLFFSHCFSYSIILCFVICFISLWYYSYLVKNLLSYSSGSFTLGEAQAISQGVILFLHCCIIICLNEWNALKSLHIIQVSESISCLQILLLGTLMLVQTLYAVPLLRQGVRFFLSCFVVLLIMMITWHITLKKNVFVWLFTFCMYSRTRVLLILFWIFCTFSSILVVIMTHKQKSPKGSTIIRKYFHLIINAIYIPGIIYDLELLRFASGVALTIFILLEVCRILNVPIIGPMIEDAFQVFLDEKDSGFLILTHIYLLMGCSTPFYLSGYNLDSEGFNISLFSGVISVGFGDTAAAIGGTLFGRRNWNGSKKTYEGSICGFIMQLIVSLFFLYYGHLFSTWNILLIAVAIFLTSLLEAKTTQVDNLVLPLFMFSFVSWIH